MNRCWLAALLLLTACSGRPSNAPDAQVPTRTDGGAGATAPPAPAGPLEILRLEDARDLDGLRRLAKLPAPADRRRLALALGRTQDEGAREPLRRLLLDEVPEVRDAAAFGLGLLGNAAGEDEERALLGRLAAESALAGRVALADALGRIGKAAALPALAALLQDPEPRVRSQAALALGGYALREVEVDPERVAALAGRLADSAPAVRASAAYAIGRIGKLDREGSGEVIRGLEGALADADPDVRMMAARALAAAPPGPPAPLLARVDDPSWQVRVNVVRALAKRAGPGAAQAVRTAMHGAWERVRRGGLGTAELHPLVAALEVAADLVDNPALRAEVQAIHDSSPGVPGPSVAHDLVQCLAAFALDRASNWPRFVTTCGTPTIPGWRRTVLEAKVIGAAHGDELARAGRLAKLWTRAPDPSTHVAVLEAAAQVDAEPARKLLTDGLGDPDPAVVATAADGIAKVASKLVRIDPAAIREAQVPDGQDPAPAPMVPDTRVTDRLVTLLERFGTGPEVETLLSVIDAVGAMKLASTADRLVPLLRHPVLAVRQKAAEAYQSIRGESAPRPGPPLAPLRPLDALAASGLVGQPHRALLKTSRGDIRIVLRSEDTPATVLNFITLARQGFYRGKTLHRLVSNFVIQGGDPRGDGYGGPGYTIRCEDDPAPYVRGAVGMALAGPDTGGSQFFITHSRQPHLDGRYTLFGEVVEGLEVVALLVPGDTLVDVLIE